MNYVDPKALLAHHGWVRALARTLVRNGAAADDLEQEAWVRALGPQPRPVSNVKSWLAAIVHNTARDGWRREGRVARLNRRLAADCEPGQELGGERLPEETPDERQVRMETHKAMLTALTNLEDPYGTVVYLRFVDELSVEQIASKLGRPQATVRTQLRRGLDRMQESMQANLGTDWRARVVLLVSPSLKSTSTALATGGLTLMGLKSIIASVVAVFVAAFVWNGSGTSSEALQGTSTVTDSEVLADLRSPGSKTTTQRTPLARVIEPSAVEPDAQQLAPGHEKHTGIKVIVRDPQTMDPIPGAEVLVFDRASPDDDDFSEAMFEQWLDMETLLERFGETHRVDGSGVLWLPERKSYMHLAARHNGSFAQHGLLTAAEPGKIETVELFPVPQVHTKVLVLDADGNPVAQQFVEYQQVPFEDWGQRLKCAVTDEHGIALFRNMREQFNQSQGNWTFRFAVPIPGLNIVAETIAPKSPPENPITLRLPPLATVVVHVLDENGEPIKGQKRVTIQALPEDGGELCEMQKDNMQTTNSQLGGRDLWASNGQVSCQVIPGQELMAWTSFGYSGERTVLKFQGPLNPGESVETTLKAKRDLGMASLSIVDAAGVPTEAFRFDSTHVRLDGPLVGSNQDIFHQTSANGVMLASAPAILLPDGTSSDCLEGATFIHRAQGNRLQFGWTHWTLGKETKLVLGPQLLASGQLQYGPGKPVGGCDLTMTVRLPWTDPADKPSRANRKIMGFETDAEGKFEVYGPFPSPGHSYEFVAMQSLGDRSFRPIPIPFEPGQRDLAVTMRDPAWIEGHIQVDPGIVDLLRIQIKQVGVADSLPHGLDTHGRFKFRADFEGQAKLILTSGGATIAESPVFEVKNGVDTCPDGWSSLDLRGQLTLHTVQVEAASGTLPKWVTVMLVDHGQGSSYASPAHFVTREESVLIYVTAHGFEASEQQTISGQAQITLTPYQ